MTIVLAALLVLAPAQQMSDSGTFRVVVDGTRVGSEQFTIARNGTGYLATGRTEIERGGQKMTAESRMTLDDQFRPLLYEYESDAQTIRLVIDDPVSEITMSGSETTLDIRFPAGGAIVDDNFFHHYLLLLRRLGADGGAMAVFVPQQMTLGSLRVEPTGDRQYRIETENLVLDATVDGSGRLIRLAVPEAGVVVER
jgi:hypothetical protein